MLDIGWTELLVIGVVALIVVGPEDLPRLFHTLGRITGRVRSMAREFSSAMEDAARSTGVDDVMRDIKGTTSRKSMGLDALDRVADRLDDTQPRKIAAVRRQEGRPESRQENSDE